ncbi:MFS general substrate transporter [Teratosphaeria nubilosa]|uniref:MFS general substrate transporter n=1 Tax=Teratosphaeria nubilosa TaxID=161662 RepID=A0A6G1L7N9_9PEZI|nr:MFS general substrate transporter [Teratosphaeria nubilosa]
MDIDLSTTVPGTVHLIDLPGQHTSGAHASDDIVLVPQPSSDPEDPLNWTRRRKFWSLAMVFVYTLGVGIATTLHYSIMTDITHDTGITTTDLVQGNGVMFLFLGWGCLICQPIALTYGRRGTYVMSALAMVPLMIWTRYATTAGEWFAQRIIIGIVAAPIEALPEISIPDVFFAHERGTWISGYVLTLFGSNFIAPLIAGWFDDAFGWRWTMYFGAIVSAVTAVILFFGMEETMYFRQTVEGVEVVNADGDVGVVAVDGKEGEKSVTPVSESRSKQIQNAAVPMRRSYLSKLKPFGRRPGSPTVPQMFTMMYRPLLIILKFPNIAWAGFIYGINLSWYNVMNGTASPVLSASPYNWSAALVGCIYAGPIVGAIFACTLAGTLTDRLALYLARRNNGIREPEQRLWPLTIAGVMSGAGLITWGVGAYHGIHWSGLAFGLGMMVFGLVVGGAVALAYAVDCFKEISGESMASVIIIRNTIGFGFSYAITPWYTGMGLQNCFILAGFVALACMSTFLLMLSKGKALRAASASTYWRYVESSILNVGH